MGRGAVVSARPDEQALLAALERVNDPHVPASLRSMGMLAAVDCDADGHARVEVRMPCMACPGAARIVDEVKAALADLPGVDAVSVELGWSGDWQREMVEPPVRELMRRNGILL